VSPRSDTSPQLKREITPKALREILNGAAIHNPQATHARKVSVITDKSSNNLLYSKRKKETANSDQQLMTFENEDS